MKSPARIIFEKEIDQLIKGKGFNIEMISSVRQYFKRVSDNIGLSIGFGFTSYMYPGHIGVSSSLGICFDNISRLNYQLNELHRYTKYCLHPTISHELYMLLPGAEFFEYDLDQSNLEAIPLTCRQIMNDIHQYGSVFFDRYQDWDNVVYSFEKEKGYTDYERDTILPIMYYLMGNKQKGLDYIKRRLEEPLTSPDSVRIKRKAYTYINGDVFLKNYYALPEIPDQGFEPPAGG